MYTAIDSRCRLCPKKVSGTLRILYAAGSAIRKVPDTFFGHSPCLPTRGLGRALIAASLLTALQLGFAQAAPKARKSRKAPAAAEQELYGISWHKSVDGALQAAVAESSGKPVFWLRMLGELGGYS